MVARRWPNGVACPKRVMNLSRYQIREEKLSPRHLAIIALVLQGCANKEIAEKLGYTLNVVKNYLRFIYEVTGSSSRLELATMVIRDDAMRGEAEAALFGWEKKLSPINRGRGVKISVASAS